MKDIIIEEIERRITKLSKELTDLETKRVEKQGRFDALFSLRVALKHQVKFKVEEDG
jgi:hypothetical protein